jgi:acetyl-CoA C-acetyltransferase
MSTSITHETAKTVIHSMRRDRFKHGLVIRCIGGGQGIALAIETMP